MLINIVFGLAAFALNLVLTPKPQDAKPASLGDFKAPTAEEGREIPVLFGTRELVAPNVVWYGDLKRIAIKGERRYGFFGPKQTIGWRYLLGMHMALCHGPADKCIKIRVANKTAFEGVAPGGPITIWRPGLFGGDDSEGGIAGTLDLEMGEPTQDQNDYLLDKLDTLDVPAFRGVVCAVLRRMYIGNNPYLKPWAFTLQRIFLRSDGSDQWYSAKAAVPTLELINQTEDEEGIEVADGLTINNNGQFDFVGDYGAYSEHNDVKVWDLEGNETDIEIPGYIAGGGRLHITQYGELLVMAYGNIFGGQARRLQFRSISDPETVLQEFIVSAELNYGFNAAEYRGTLLLKEGPTIFQNMDWHFFTRNEETGEWELEFTEAGINYPGTEEYGVQGLELGPNYGYANITEPSDSILRVTVNGTWSEDIIDLSSIITGGVRGIVYSNGEVIITTSTAIYVFNEDVSHLIRVREDIPIGSRQLRDVSGKRMTNGAGSLIIAESQDSGSTIERILQIQISTLDTVDVIDMDDVDFVNKNDDFDYMAFNPENGYLMIVQHFGSFNFWPLFAIGEDMNPAHIIRECLTDVAWGMGYNESDIDDTSFQAAADTFYAEGFGISMLWQTEEEIGEFINQVLAHVDAFLYVSRETGQFVLKPIRDDYDIDTIPVVDEDDITDWNEVQRRQPAEAVTSVIVKYHDRSKDKDASRAVHNIAQIAQTGEMISATRSYLGISGANLAVRVGTRDVKALSAGMASGWVTCKRTVESMNPGDPFRLVSSRRGFSGEVMRVTELAFGDGRDNRVGMKFIQDSFHLGTDILVDGGESPWENPHQDAEPMTIRMVEEMSYRDLIQMQGLSNVSDMLTDNPGAGVLHVAGTPPVDNTLSALVSIDEGSGYVDVTEPYDQLAPGALLAADIGRGDLTFDVTDDVDLDQIVEGQLAVIGTEVVRIDDVTGQTLTVGRGCLDTVPQAHSAGDAIVFYDDFSFTDFEIRASSDQIDVQLIPVTSNGELLRVSAPEDTVAFNSRAIRPYAPKNCTLGASMQPGYDEDVALNFIGVDPIPANWANRNRVDEPVLTPLDWEDATQTPEAGQTTVITLTDLDGVTVHQYTGLSGTSHNIDVGDFAGESEGYVVFSSSRDGYGSWQTYRIRVKVSFGALLLESGDKLLLESGDNIRLEAQ